MSAWVMTDDGWRHAPWWKMIINTALRAVQRGPRKWMIYTCCNETTTPPTVVSYGFGPVQMREEP